MFKKYMMLIAVIVISCTGCAKATYTGGINGNVGTSGGMHYADELTQTEQKNVSLIVFRYGDKYIAKDVNSGGWSEVVGEPPAKLAMTDGDFASVTADIVLNYGGVAGFMGNPTIHKVRNYQLYSFDDAVNSGMVGAYDPDVEYPVGPKYYGQFVVLRTYEGYRVYDNGILVDQYKTSLEAESAMGLAVLADTTAVMEKHSGHHVYVFRMGDTYLGYSNQIGLNSWQPILDENFQNKLVGCTLDDGHMIEIIKGDEYIVNGGNGNYHNSFMIRSIEEYQEASYDEFFSSHWAEDGPRVNGAVYEYNVCDYLIFYIDGLFYVYDDAPRFVGAYATEEEVDQVIGRN